MLDNFKDKLAANVRDSIRIHKTKTSVLELLKNRI